MSNVRRGFIITLMSSNGMMVISFIASLFIARLLTPEEIGIFSVAYVFAGLLRTIREMGLGSYLVQETELTPLRIRTAFGISLLISFACAFILLALSAFAGRFYNEPRITDVLNIVAVGFFLVPFGATTMSLLRRDLRFGDIARIDLTSTIAQNGCAVLLAWLGFGFMSLAWSALVGILTSVLGVLFYRPAGLPWKPSLSEWRRVLSFSSYVSGSSLLTFAHHSASDLLLGKIMGMEAVAYFNRAHGLSTILGTVLNRAVSAVSLPYFAEQNRSGSSMLQDWRHSTAILHSFTIPFFATLAISASTAIPVLFGDQWQQSIPVLQILAISAVFESSSSLTRQILTAAGRVQQLLGLDLFGLTLRVALILLSAPYGLYPVALTYAGASVLLACIRTKMLHNQLNFSLNDLLYTYKWSLLPTILIALPALLIQESSTDPILKVVLLALAFATIWPTANLLGENPSGKELRKLFSKLKLDH